MIPEPTEQPGKDIRADVSELEDVVRRAGLILSHVSLYGLQHNTTREVVRDTYRKLSVLLSRYHQFEVQLEPSCVRINGVAVGRHNPVVQGFATHLLNLDISHFSLVEGLTEEQFGKLLEVLGTDSAKLAGSGGFSQAVSSSDLGKHVLDVRTASGEDDLAGSVPPPLTQVEPAAGDGAFIQEAPADYYLRGSRKLRDFLVGMFGLFNLQVAATILLVMMADTTVGKWFAPWLAAALQIVCLVGIPTYFFRKKRRFIAIGYLSSLCLLAMLPLILVGACFLMLAGGGLKF